MQPNLTGPLPFTFRIWVNGFFPSSQSQLLIQLCGLPVSGSNFFTSLILSLKCWQAASQQRIVLGSTAIWHGFLCLHKLQASEGYCQWCDTSRISAGARVSQICRTTQSIRPLDYCLSRTKSDSECSLSRHSSVCAIFTQRSAASQRSGASEMSSVPALRCLPAVTTGETKSAALQSHVPRPEQTNWRSALSWEHVTPLYWRATNSCQFEEDGLDLPR